MYILHYKVFQEIQYLMHINSYKNGQGTTYNEILILILTTTIPLTVLINLKHQGTLWALF